MGTLSSSVLLILAAIAAVYGQSCENADADVLILGAGMSGISAARTLFDNGVTDFIILEQARDCVHYVVNQSVKILLPPVIVAIDKPRQGIFPLPCI